MVKGVPVPVLVVAVPVRLSEEEVWVSVVDGVLVGNREREEFVIVTGPTDVPEVPVDNGTVPSDKGQSCCFALQSWVTKM